MSGRVNQFTNYFRQDAAEAEGPGGASPVAGPLPGQVLVNLEKDFPEART